MTGTKKDSGYAVDPDEWYVEDQTCVRSLFEAMPWFRANGGHDPCCGGGNIPRVAASLGAEVTGADLRDRVNGLYPVQNFFSDNTRRKAIITNPPFSLAVDIVKHAFDVVEDGGYIAIIGQAKFLFSQARHPLFMRREMDRVLVLSRRPSMPPGKLLAEKGESIRGNGFHDFAWYVWRVGKTTVGATVSWLP